MHTSVLIKRHIFKLAKSAIFSTREMLNYGTRAAVDQCLYRLVKSKRIIRLAWGLFMRADSNNPKPSLLEIATEKARAFKRTILADRVGTTQLLWLTKLGNQKIIYATDGRASSFSCGQTRIYFKNICPRRISLQGSSVGRVIGTLWQLGKAGCTESLLSKATSHFTQREHKEFHHSAHLMPAWMTKLSC
jgi:hypothetical protein